jgi:hypothetical protein
VKVIASITLSAALLISTAPVAQAAPAPITAVSSADSTAPLAKKPKPSHRVEAPSRGGVGRWGDSNVASVWNGVPLRIRSLGMCIRHHESIRAGHYRARNRSGAGGAYQFMPRTFAGNARYTVVNGKYIARPYAHTNPSQVPAFVQDAVFIHAIRHGGIRAWHGTNCPGTG